MNRIVTIAAIRNRPSRPEIERKLLSMRTKGRLGQSRLNGKKDDIQKLFDLRVSKASIAKITGIDRSMLYHFMRSRHLLPQGQ